MGKSKKGFNWKARNQKEVIIDSGQEKVYKPVMGAVSAQVKI